ncbi:hypothetical protein A3860_16390 [Niastella vici]|uniref:Uncharacterized protein n=1 Tax=Niastella vici TaxID=1703345 RepID=A0A1V9G419_9BACT|nr:hypothetical protein A3860_16390 [Niastella vici]
MPGFGLGLMCVSSMFGLCFYKERTNQISVQSPGRLLCALATLPTWQPHTKKKATQTQCVVVAVVFMDRYRFQALTNDHSPMTILSQGTVWKGYNLKGYDL